MAAESSAISVLTPRAPLSAVCKCCGKIANLFGVVDFHKNCEIRRQNRLRLSGIPIFYYQCSNCGFIFTTAFDHFAAQDFATHIYNEQYILVDPEYAGVRPRQNAQGVRAMFPGSSNLRILDYGAGSGQMAQSLRESGFTNVLNYDPFNPNYTARPEGKFDLVVCFEVMEHTPRPRETINEIVRFLDEPGLVLFTTVFQPANILQVGTNWWYAAPRDGHVSLYTAAAMAALLTEQNYKLTSLNDHVHLMHRAPPSWATHLFSQSSK
jgi:2-polyprenyl-3-methyl-5-hydroxy-6-metoxy-1,4-benzoquinol methylase